MTISFRCPHCNALCAFVDKFAGRRAKCVTCQKKFIIPDVSDAKVVKIKEEKEKPGRPTPGFYTAFFGESWAAIFHRETLSTITYLFVMVILKMAIGGAALIWGSTIKYPAGLGLGVFFFIIQVVILVILLLSFCCVWGRIIELYMDVISDTGFGIDQLPPERQDMDFPLWGHAIKPFLMFWGTMMVAFMPYFLGDMFFMYAGIERGSIFALNTDATVILQVLWLLSVLSIPSIIIHIAITRDWMCLRPDFVFKPIFKAFGPYLILVLMFIAVFFAESATNIAKPLLAGDMPLVILKGFLNIFLQILILWTMRGAGLFYRHYDCYFKF